jgi:LIM domain kinase 1
VWEIGAKLDALELRRNLPMTNKDTTERTIVLIIAKTVKAVKVALGLSRETADAAPAATAATAAATAAAAAPSAATAAAASAKKTAPATPAKEPVMDRRSRALTPPPVEMKQVNIDEVDRDDKYISPSKLQLQEELGRGAFGLVYKGVYQQNVVAVKSMAISDDDVRELITREVSLLKEVSHPAIVKFIGISKRAAQELLLVMEFVPGGELYDLLTDSSVDVTWDMKLSWASDIASALSYLHDKSIIHRDLKSENILVCEDISKVKLADFGFARIAERQTQRMSLCGSMYFNAPELILGEGYNSMVDIYSYGIFLLEVITRASVDLTRSEDNHFTLDVKELRKSMPDDCPDQFWMIAFSCCNFNPEKRPTANKLVSYLNAVKVKLASLKK